MRIRCEKCKEIVVENYEKWIVDTKGNYVQCPYCGHTQEINTGLIL